MTGGRRDRLSVRVLLAYALPGFVIALPTIPVFVHLPTLYGIELGLGLSMTGIIILVARAFDTITDPLIGTLSDRFAFRRNHRKPWIAIGAIIAGIGLFKVLNPSVGAGPLYLLGWSVFLYTGWTMVAVPYLAWGAELSDDYHQRTRITSLREGAGLLGIIGAGALTAVVVGLGWTEIESVGVIAWAAIGVGVIVFPLLLTTVPDLYNPTSQSRFFDFAQMLAGIRSLAANKLFLRLLCAWFLNGLANGIPAALFFIYLEYGLGAGAQMRPLFILVYFAAAIVFIPAWLKLSDRLGKHRSWSWAMIAACAAFVTVPWIDSGNFLAFVVVCVVTGAALGADLALPPAIQADVVDYDELRTRRARAGVQFALWGMSTKLALAVAVGLALPGLEIGGFDPSAPTEAGRYVLIGLYALAPVVIKLAAIALVWSFPLTAEKHAIVRRRLSRRHATQDSA